MNNLIIVIIVVFLIYFLFGNKKQVDHFQFDTEPTVVNNFPGIYDTSNLKIANMAVTEDLNAGRNLYIGNRNVAAELNVVPALINQQYSLKDEVDNLRMEVEGMKLQINQLEETQPICGWTGQQNPIKLDGKMLKFTCSNGKLTNVVH